MFQPEVPSQLILGFVASSAYSGDYKRSPFYFQSFDCNFVGLYLDGQSYPAKPLQPDFKSKNYLEAYRTLTAYNKEIDIDRREYARGCTLFILDVNPRMIFNTKRKGHCRLETVPIHQETNSPADGSSQPCHNDQGDASAQQGPSSRTDENDSCQPGESNQHSSQPGPSSRPDDGGVTNYHCRNCMESFPNRRELHIHRMRTHYQRGGGLQHAPWRNNPAPFGRDRRARECYETNRPLILENHQEGPVNSIYNVPLTNNFTVPQIMQQAQNIYDRQKHAFRLNLEFGLILVHTETGEYRYFRPFSNESLFERPIYVSRHRNLNRLKLRLQGLNITDFILRQRPDTKWKPYMVTNVRFCLFHLNYPLGQVKDLLPTYITSSKAIVSLDKNINGVYYKDKLCAFRCLAIHNNHKRQGLETETKSLFNKWIHFMNTKNPGRCLDANHRTFKGVSLHEIAYFEKCFEINVNIYQLKENGACLSIYKSRCEYIETMHLNMYRQHVSYISNFPVYAKKYQCRTCQRHFAASRNMKKHQKICTGRTVHQFPGGFYGAKKTIFDKLEDQGIKVPTEDRLFRYFLVYDFEAMLVPVKDDQTEKLAWTHHHIPVSVSVCSNVEGYTEPNCIINPDTDDLVKEMVMYMRDVGLKCNKVMKHKLAKTFKDIDKAIQMPMKPLSQIDMDDQEWLQEVEKMREILIKLKEELEAYCRQIICLGFNSSKYDINLIKSCLAKHLNMHGCKNAFTVKRNSQYACLGTDEFKFLDITQYLAPSINYANFLKAFDVDESKGYFPYEWFDHFSKLHYPALPAHDDLYSSLKGSNISKEEYTYCQLVWKERGMKTFRDFLIWYSNLDTEPFVKAVKNLQEYYFRRYIDIFKVSISVPGLSRQMLFESGRQTGASFALYDESNKDLYYTIKKGLAGGPSILFNRYCEVGKTFIRNDPSKPCQLICGYDANSLYMHCIDQCMPTGAFVRRQLEQEFKPQKRDRYTLAYHWMDYLSLTQNLLIRHKLNNGKERNIFRYHVDGFSESTNTVFQFHGCYFHGHKCWMTEKITDKKWLETRDIKFQKTQKITKILKSLGYKVVEMYECQFRTQIRFDSKLQAFINARQPVTPARSVTEADILQAVREDKLFGMVEVDITVPEQWPDHFKHPSMTPYQYFEEMSPLFCTTEVPFDVIGDHMQGHARRFNLSQKPRRLLVGGMKARQILLATLLLKWYLEHGLTVTKIYQTVEFQKQACFQQFVQDVTDARRVGDLDKTKAIIADTRKLEGNSAYGSTIMDQEKFQSVKYVQGEGDAMLEANLPQFKKITTLLEEEEYYEVEKAKKSIRLDLPVQIGFFILQYAKLHMLQFYYDFMDKYVDRADFEYCEMDTDSAYMALSGPDLLSVIKPHMRDDYLHNLQGYCRENIIVKADGEKHWFPRTCCSTHAKYDRRTPGLFKLEYEGDTIIGLCSKTYIVSKTKTISTSLTVLAASKLLRRAKRLRPKKLQIRSKTTREIKFSSKGITKRRVKAPLTIFKNVLKTQRAGQGSNKGFRSRHNGVYTYEQQRNGFPYFYCKRRVLSDGILTVPLDLELCPYDKRKQKSQDDEEALMDGDTQSEMETEEEAINDFEVMNALSSLLEES